MKKIILGAVLVLTFGLLIGCGGEDTDNGNKISVVGSTSVTPIIEELSESFMKKNKDIKVEVQGVGSSAGIKSISEKNCNIGMSSRNLKEEEKSDELEEYVLAYDGIAVVLNPKNSVDKLTQEELVKIYKGDITNWKELGGKDKEILVVQREAASGTRGAFEELLDIENKVLENALIAEGNGSVKANVAKKENAIGYLSLSYLDESIKNTKIDGYEATVENIKNGKYKISRPFLLLLNKADNKAVNKFIEFLGSEEAQEIIGKTLVNK